VTYKRRSRPRQSIEDLCDWLETEENDQAFPHTITNAPHFDTSPILYFGLPGVRMEKHLRNGERHWRPVWREPQPSWPELPFTETPRKKAA
jgi:hypothetical protein